MTLLMRDIEHFEKGKEIGEIYGEVLVFQEMGLPDNEISKMIQKRHGLSENEANLYLAWSAQDMVLYTWMKSIYHGMGLSDCEISEKIQVEHGLTEDEVDSYLIQSAKGMLNYIKNEISLSEID